MFLVWLAMTLCRIHVWTHWPSLPELELFSATDRNEWHVDPTTLAALLVDEGLPITHQNIEMIMCYGTGLSLTSQQTVQSFCQRLAGALSGFGYKQIKVRATFGMAMGPDLSVNPSLTPTSTLVGKKLVEKLVIDPNKNVTPNDPHHQDLFVTYTPTTMKVGRRPEVHKAQS
jgi:hypothetical protein